MLVRLVHDVFVHLVGNYESIPLFREIGDELQLVQRENFAYWIVRCVDDDAFGFLVEKTLHLFSIEHPVARGNSARSNFLKNKV